MALEARSGKSACPDKNTTMSKPSFWLVLHFQRRMPPKADNLKLAAMEGRVGYVLDKNWLVCGERWRSVVVYASLSFGIQPRASRCAEGTGAEVGPVI